MNTAPATSEVAGAVMFARFAAPPNRLGYCGPDDHDRLVAYGTGELRVDGGLHRIAAAFDGAWPWLELLATAAGTDPLDPRVVEAYWIGNDLVTRVPALDLGNHLAARFGPRAGRDGSRIVDAVGQAAVANHAFHVFGVYPWVGLLREGRGGDVALSVIDSCRVSWGRVVDATGAPEGAGVVVERAPLTWDGASLALGAPAHTVVDGSTPAAGDPAGAFDPGDLVAIHWSTICQRLDVRAARWLSSLTHLQIAAANAAGLAGRL